MNTLNITLPESLGEFVESQARAGGHSSPGEYVLSLLNDLQKRQAREKVEAMVLEGIKSPARAITAEDWDRLHRQVDQVETSSNHE
jgi:antitoxin ParD1/3/4